jgi:hypothetical protein
VSRPYRAGHFVWCRFPQREQPHKPGSKVRIGYVAITRQAVSGTVVALLYTTTKPLAPPLPLGVIPIDERQARALGQKPFLIDARSVAVLPVTEEYFPHLARVDRGVQGEASAGLARKIKAMLADLHRRGVVIEVRGPKRP